MRAVGHKNPELKQLKSEKISQEEGECILAYSCIQACIMYKVQANYYSPITLAAISNSSECLEHTIQLQLQL
jgi:succinate dehydrogenase/fumarate reductase-like Fe-S protein